MKTKIRPPVKWHGGKCHLAARIAALLPVHGIYVEPFGGAASVLLNKEPSQVEVYNDLDLRLTRLFRVLRDHGDDFRRRLALTPYSEVEFRHAAVPHYDEVEQARRDFVRLRQSLGGRGDHFSFSVRRSRRGMADVVSGFLSAIDEELPKIIDRLRTVQIVFRPAVEVIRRFDGPDTLFYCDPPYLPETRAENGRAKYAVEMTVADHRALLEELRWCRGRVALSGYPSALYDELLWDWRVVEFDVANHAAAGEVKRRETECLWFNWPEDNELSVSQPNITHEAACSSHPVCPPERSRRAGDGGSP